MNTFNFERTGKSAASKKRFPRLLAICAAAGVIAIGSTLAANLNLNTGHPVEFGQGVSQATACTGTDYLTVTDIGRWTRLKVGWEWEWGWGW